MENLNLAKRMAMVAIASGALALPQSAKADIVPVNNIYTNIGVNSYELGFNTGSRDLTSFVLPTGLTDTNQVLGCFGGDLWSCNSFVNSSRNNLVDIFYSGASINPHTDISFAYLVNTGLVPLNDLTAYSLMDVNAVLGGPLYDGSNNNLPIQTFDLSAPIAQPVPEPTSAILFGTGLIGLIGLAAIRKNKNNIN